MKLSKVDQRICKFTQLRQQNRQHQISRSLSCMRSSTSTFNTARCLRRLQTHSQTLGFGGDTCSRVSWFRHLHHHKIQTVRMSSSYSLVPMRPFKRTARRLTAQKHKASTRSDNESSLDCLLHGALWYTRLQIAVDNSLPGNARSNKFEVRSRSSD